MGILRLAERWREGRIYVNLVGSKQVAADDKRAGSTQHLSNANIRRDQTRLSAVHINTQPRQRGDSSQGETWLYRTDEEWKSRVRDHGCKESKPPGT